MLLIPKGDAVDGPGTLRFASCPPSDVNRMSKLDRLSVPFSDSDFRVMLNLLGTAGPGKMGKTLGNLSTLRDQVTKAIDLLITGI